MTQHLHKQCKYCVDTYTCRPSARTTNGSHHQFILYWQGTQALTQIPECRSPVAVVTTVEDLTPPVLKPIIKYYTEQVTNQIFILVLPTRNTPKKDVTFLILALNKPLQLSIYKDL